MASRPCGSRSPSPGPRTGHRQGAGRAPAPRETTLVTPGSLSGHPHPCLSVCLVLSLCLSLHLSHSPCFSLCFCLSLHSPLPLCRDPWRSPMAWTCPTRARSTPSTSARSARSWATIVAGCSEPAPPPQETPLPVRLPCRVSLCAWGQPRGLTRWAGVSYALVSCVLTVLRTRPPPRNTGSLGLSPGGPGVCVQETGVSRGQHPGPHKALGVPCRRSSSETPFGVSSLVLATSALNVL